MGEGKWPEAQTLLTKSGGELLEDQLSAATDREQALRSDLKRLDGVPGRKLDAWRRLGASPGPSSPDLVEAIAAGYIFIAWPSLKARKPARRTHAL